MYGGDKMKEDYYPPTISIDGNNPGAEPAPATLVAVAVLYVYGVAVSLGGVALGVEFAIAAANVSSAANWTK